MGTDCINCKSKKSGFFCGLDSDIVEKIVDHKVDKKLKKGEVLYVAGQQGEGIYCIQSGKIKIVRKEPNGKDAMIHINGQGDMAGHYHLFQSENYVATATALEDTNLCYIKKDFLMKTIEEHPALALQFLKYLSQELKSSDLRLTSFISKNVKSRLADLLIQMSAKYGTQLHERIRIDVRLTREEIASLAGTVNETVTRFMTEFKECGFVEEKDKILYILQPEKLKEISNH